MKTDTPLSRRHLLARVPAVAAAAVSAAATALPGLATAIPDHLDVTKVKGLAEMLAKLEGMPTGEADKVLTAITEVLECGMDTHAHDTELLTLKPQFDEMFKEWWEREETRKLHPANYSPRTDENVERDANTQDEMIGKILSYSPLTREGLALQCRALIMGGFESWDDRTAKFVGTLVLFFRWELPDMLAVKLFTRGQDDQDEDDEHEA